MDNRQIVIESLPRDKLAANNFALRSEPAAQPGPGEVLCRTLVLTVGAGQRAGPQGSASYAGAPVDGSERLSGDCVRRVLRGGSWFIDPRNLRAAYRNRLPSGLRINISGFRVARTLTP